MIRVSAPILLAAISLFTAESGFDALSDLEGQLKSHPNDLGLLERYGQEARQGFGRVFSKGSDPSEDYVRGMTTFLEALEPTDASAKERIADLLDTAAVYGRLVQSGRCSFDRLRRDLTAKPDDIKTMLVYEIKIQADYGKMTRKDPHAAVDGLAEEKRFLTSLRGRADEKVRKIIDALCNGTIPRMERGLEYALDWRRMIGQAAPTLGDISAWVNGDSISEQQLRGKVVLLDFWAVWCGPCVAALPELRAWHEEFAARGLVTIGVTGYYNYPHDESESTPRGADDHPSPERERKRLAEFAKRHQIPYPIALEEGHTLTQRFKVEALPQLFLIDRLVLQL